MGKECTTGRVTIPTDVDVVPETLELVKRWGADAIRDCDGTDYPEELMLFTLHEDPGHFRRYRSVQRL